MNKLESRNTDPYPNRDFYHKDSQLDLSDSFEIHGFLFWTLSIFTQNKAE